LDFVLHSEWREASTHFEIECREFECCWSAGSSGFEEKEIFVPFVEASAENSAAQGGK
jgi:hypothetical protein